MSGVVKLRLEGTAGDVYEVLAALASVLDIAYDGQFHRRRCGFGGHAYAEVIAPQTVRQTIRDHLDEAMGR